MMEQRSLYQTNHCGAKIKVPDNSSDANPLMSVNNVCNCVARPCPKNTILIAGVSMINGINEKYFSTNFKSVKVTCFSGATPQLHVL